MQGRQADETQFYSNILEQCYWMTRFRSGVCEENQLDSIGCSTKRNLLLHRAEDEHERNWDSVQ